MIKSVVLVLSEKAATTLARALDSYQPQPGNTVVETESIIDEIKAEVAAQLKTKGNSSARQAIGFDEWPEGAADLSLDGAGGVTATKPPKKRQTKAEKIADEMAKATREAVEGG